MFGSENFFGKSHVKAEEVPKPEPLRNPMSFSSSVLILMGSFDNIESYKWANQEYKQEAEEWEKTLRYNLDLDPDHGDEGAAFNVLELILKDSFENIGLDIRQMYSSNEDGTKKGILFIDNDSNLYEPEEFFGENFPDSLHKKIETLRASLPSEINAYIDYDHLSLIVDRETHSKHIVLLSFGKLSITSNNDEDNYLFGIEEK